MTPQEGLKKYFNYIRPDKGWVVQKSSGVCEACGAYGPYIYKPVVTDILAKEWSLNKDEQKAFSSRESMACMFCGCTYRLRALAQTIVLETGKEPRVSLEELIEETGLSDYSIAEINSCGVLHGILQKAKNLRHSEYMPTDKSIEHQDLSHLTYDDASFDLVLTSDTLEHVPDPRLALKEIYRVLKPGGKHIFTIPVTLDRETKIRALIKEDKVTKIEQESFHGSGEPDYLVWTEFGGDFIKEIEKVGFTVRIYFQNPLNLKDPSGIIVAVKGGTKVSSRKTEFIDSEYKLPVFSKEKTLLGSRRLKEIVLKVPYSEQRQLAKMRELHIKTELTRQHIANLTDINQAYADEIRKLNSHMAAVKSTLEKRINEKEKYINKFLSSNFGRGYIKSQSIKEKLRRSRR